MIRYFGSISLLLCWFTAISAQEKETYNIEIKTSRMTVSGLCRILYQEEETRGVIFNEFGITFAEFSYFPSNKRVKLHSVISFLNKWYIRKVLRKDISRLMRSLPADKTDYQNKRRKITYKLERLSAE